MKFAGNDAATIVRSNVGEGKSFGIEANAKMFKLLSAGLYKHKIPAVIRELSCNAYDAHVMNGNADKPFVIELPSHDNGYTFRIRDFGVGLSDEQIQTLYTVYGRSNKSDSNDCIGGMGLGSKSPLCYVKSFNVTSYYNGQKYLYNCGFDDEGIPECTSLGVSDTIEPNGLEVSFVAQRNDVYNFSSAAGQLFPYFKVLPTFVGSNKPGIITYYKETLKDKQVKGTDCYVGNGNFVIMGQVKYPIDSSEFTPKADPNAADPWIKQQNQTFNTYTQLLNMGVGFELNIGDVEVDIGREGLQYTKATKAVLQKKFDEVVEAIKKEAGTEIKGTRNLWNAKLAYYELVNNKYYAAKALLGSVDITYNGHKINGDSTDIDTFNALTGFDVTEGHISGSKFRKYDRQKYIDHRKYNQIFINDVKSAQFAQAKRWLETHQGFRYAYIVTLGTADQQSFFDALGCDKDDVVYISSLPKIPRAANGSVSKDYCFLLDENRGQPYRSQRSASKYFEEVADDDAFDDCEAYFIIKNFEPEGTFTNDIGRLAQLVKHVREVTGANIGKIMAVKVAKADKMTKDKAYEPIKEYLTAIVNDYIAKSNIKEDIADCLHHRSYNSSGIVKDFAADNDNKLQRLLDPASPMYKALDESKKLAKFYEKNYDKVQKISDICTTLGIDISGSSRYNMEKTADEMKAKYPMLTQIRGYWGICNATVADYIKLVDSQ